MTESVKHGEEPPKSPAAPSAGEVETQSLAGWRRSHDCGSLRLEDEGREVILMGWVNSRRDLGSLIFIDLRDREGLTQIVFDPRQDALAHGRAHALRSEWVVAVRGTVARRLDGQENPRLPTGAVEVRAGELRLLNLTETPPFQVEGALDASDVLKLKYRYLELRRPRVFGAFRKRHRIAAAIRSCLEGQGFIEVETPFLTKSTPEGARDYLVPSRVSKGCFYALPQSPQLFKQLLMVAGFDRYYQIVRCFRDEDLRADRQPEFTQVDLEMSFVDEEAVMAVVEDTVRRVFREILGREIADPLPRLTFREAVDGYGSDRPDLRFDLALKDLSEPAGRSEFRIFRETLAKGGVVKAVRVPGGSGSFSRKTLDELTGFVKGFGAPGLLWIRVAESGWQSPLERFFDQPLKEAVNRRMEAAPGDLILAVAGLPGVVHQALGALRSEVARRLGLIDEQALAFTWVTQFPLLEHDPTEGRLVAVHHPFTAPMEEDIPLLETGPERAPGAGVRPGAERVGGGRRKHPDPPPEPAAEDLRPAGHLAGGGPGEVRLLPGGSPVRRPAPRRHRPGFRPAGGHHDRRPVHPRGDRLSQDHQRDLPAHRRTLQGGSGPAGRAGAPAPPGNRGVARHSLAGGSAGGCFSTLLAEGLLPGTAECRMTNDERRSGLRL